MSESYHQAPTNEPPIWVHEGVQIRQRVQFWKRWPNKDLLQKKNTNPPKCVGNENNWKAENPLSWLLQQHWKLEETETGSWKKKQKNVY